jgi:hypothetical protein
MSVNNEYLGTSLEDFKKEMEEHEKNYKWKIFDKWFPNGIAQYRAFYALTHPWLIVGFCLREVKYAWQRVFSFDERIVWSIDYYLAEMIPLWLKRLKENKIGTPYEMYDQSDWNPEKSQYVDGADEKAREKWDITLGQMIEGFEAYKKISDESLWERNPEYAGLKEKFDNGMQLFVKHFGNLWD